MYKRGQDQGAAHLSREWSGQHMRQAINRLFKSTRMLHQETPLDKIAELLTPNLLL